MIIEAIKDDNNEEAPIAAERQVYVKLHVFVVSALAATVDN